MKQQTKNTTARRKAQGMVEYIVIVGLVGVAMVGAVKWFGATLDRAFDEGTHKMTTNVLWEIEDAGQRKLTQDDQAILELLSRPYDSLTPEEQERVDSYSF